MHRIVVAVVVGHGLIHLLGAVKGFGWAANPAGGAKGANDEFEIEK